ncbi:class I fructose-bisphosphate aldolase [Moorella sp. Hama-1]|uniref:class I fructose-bisphosphate aldolase n=1 Tax=Moorella sp. Hama-1 TaxID=2138101 RepID=UPI000D6587F7|nr:deoxyribose-phosphate aldolase [Moorella sp. Hama-1]MDN5361895.1 fructose-bisphosphate aldolase, class [Moorella sp. (in: firmicutes)]BCV21358.1 aldolase [Moorella sp. Hama-1]
MGKYKRLQHILRPDDRTVIVAMDHGGTSGPMPGIVNPEITLQQVIAGGADAILTTVGVAKNFERVLGSTGLIIRLDFPATDLVTGVYDCELFIEVEEAVRLGADAVILSAGPGQGVERKTLKNLSRVAQECERYGMPLIAEMYPGGFNGPAEMITIDNLKLAARIAAEWGADMVKMPYRPGFDAVTAGCYIPIVVLGGAKTNNEEIFFTNIWDALRNGAQGVAIGRNIWGHPQPARVLKVLNALVHEKTDVATAMAHLVK